MSIYNKESYSQSKVIYMAGPIEWWWQENRFDTPEAVTYREWREYLSAALVDAGYLTFRPWDAFKGMWNERMQGVNDYVVDRSDLLITMKPHNVEALGTDSEVRRARRQCIPVISMPPMTRINWDQHIKMWLVEIAMVLEGQSKLRLTGLL